MILKVKVRLDYFNVGTYLEAHTYFKESSKVIVPLEDLF
jgi:hypothetical protein